MKKILVLTLLVNVVLVFGVTQALAFQKEGCGAGDCRDCHKLTKEDAAKALKGMVKEPIHEVTLSEVPGLWTVITEQDGKKIPLYMDFSAKYMISGRILKLENQVDLSMENYINLNKIDVSLIPLEDALVIGDPKAKEKIVVFDDPECTFCKKFHPEMNKVVAMNKDVAFFIKLFPLLDIHPKSYMKSKAIWCAKSTEMLQLSLDGKDVPPATCETDQIDKNIALAGKLGITSTPTLVFADGRVIPGALSAEEVIERLAQK